jgi:hypothetical protein
MLKPILGKRPLLAAACLVLLFATIGQAADRKDRLTEKEKRVIDYLVHDWDEDYSATSVDLAMDAVGVKQSDETRFHIGSYIKEHPELHEVIRRWSWVTFVLTADEKLIARALINAQRDGKPAPSIAEIAKAVSVNDDRVKHGPHTQVGGWGSRLFRDGPNQVLTNQTRAPSKTMAMRIASLFIPGLSYD